MDKYLTYLNTVLIATLLALVLLPHSVKLGNTPPVGTATQFYDVNLDTSSGLGTGTYYVNGIPAIASSSGGVAANVTTVNATTSLTVGGGTPVTKILCTSLATTTGNIGASSTFLFPVAFTGVDPTKNQAITVSIATTSADNILALGIASTTNVLAVSLKNNGAAWNVATATYSICLTQF